MLNSRAVPFLVDEHVVLCVRAIRGMRLGVMSLDSHETTWVYRLNHEHDSYGHDFITRTIEAKVQKTGRRIP